ncbi:DUF5688 family protein [Butyrivibrio sp. XPD2006]|uniref:DUF5688 family protein n=1 Tax=Butyrivibrio sp. XPD2006 TaxID=1280668 RepID=UPI0003B6DAA0|nr:DUF5688 family protein [Butyrivibrio sp. XPD2006]
MEIKEFSRVMAREVSDKLGKGIDIECSEVLKNNGVVYHALTIRKEGECIAPTIYIDQLLERYNRGTLLMSLVDDVVNMYRKCAPATDTNIDFFDDFSVVSQHLFFKAVNYKKNMKKLENVPIKRVLDLALVPLALFEHPRLGSGTVMIENSYLDIWEISKDELWENVVECASKVAPPKIRGLMDFLSKVTGNEEEVDELCGIYVISNTAGNLGAGVVFYPGLLQGLADDHECNLFIIPSSIHECIVIPDSNMCTETGSLRDIIREVNRSTVADEEVLSDNLYMYDRETDKFFIVKEG